MDEFRDSIRRLVKQGLVDIMLMSASTSEVLAIEEGLFVDSAVTPAVRMNDTSDIWLAAGSGTYPGQPALPFSTTTIPHAQWGRLEPPGAGPWRPGAGGGRRIAGWVVRSGSAWTVCGPAGGVAYIDC